MPPRISSNINSRAQGRRPMIIKGLVKQQGSSLIIGVFIITVMFLLAATLIDILDDADEQFNLEVWGTRALAAANSGADSALAQLFPLTATDATAVSCTNVSASWSPPDVVGFHQCSVDLTCTLESVDGENQYRITSNAVCETGDCTSDTATCLRVSRLVAVEARD